MQLLRGLTVAQWQTQSLCAGWTVRDVAAHLAARHLTGRRRIFRLNPRLALLETVVHQQDIRRPLGAAREIPAAVLCTVLLVAAQELPRAGGRAAPAGLRPAVDRGTTTGHRSPGLARRCSWR